MTDSKHTPGPWEARGLAIWEPGKTAMSIAFATQHHKDARDNARLIAAAPELLDDSAFLVARIEELDWSGGIDQLEREWNGHVAPALYRLRAAIAKATGAA